MLLALAEQQDVRSDVLPRIATGFCGGIARTGDLCGVVTGAVMGMGLALGRQSPEEKRDRLFYAVQTFIGQFEAQFGSLTCPGLTGCHLGTPEGRARFHELGLSESCHRFAAEATRLAVECIEAAKQMPEEKG
mgnify:CR=1 FL=1